MNKFRFIPFYLISFLPFPVLYLLSDLLFLIVFYLIRYRREIVVNNLKHSFPEKNDREIFRLEAKYYRHFCDLIFESLKSISMDEKSIKQRFIVTNTELLHRLYKEKRSVIMYSGHFGNWEWFAFLPLILPYQITTFYKALSNNYFDDLMKLLRSNLGAICLESKNAIRSMYKLVNHPKPIFTCIIGDQSPSFEGSNTFWTTFLQQETAFISGPEKLAQKFNLAIVFPKIKKEERGIYNIHLELLEAHPQKKTRTEILQHYAKELEKNIMDSPDLWLWSHNRWKLERTALGGKMS